MVNVKCVEVNKYLRDSNHHGWELSYILTDLFWFLPTANHPPRSDGDYAEHVYFTLLLYVKGFK